MKHVKLFESFVNELFVREQDVIKWEKENGKLPIPKEVVKISDEMSKAGFIDKSDRLFQAKLWISIENASWIEMEKKFGKLVGKFYGGQFYHEMMDVIYTKAAYYAYEVSKSVKDQVANGEEVEPAYYEMKSYFNSFGMDYNRSRIFTSAVDKLESWMKTNNINTL